MATQLDVPSHHTFLVADGKWEARGTGLVGSAGMKAAISGYTEVQQRGAGLLTARSTMIVHASIPFEVEQHYEVKSTSTPERYTFVCRNDRIGELSGEIWLLPAYILLHYASSKGRFRGSELLIRRTPGHYTAIGQFVADGSAQTVWEVQLKRVGGEESLTLD